jgi:acetyl esterase/lipase
MRLLRSRADEFGIDKNRLGAIGFSSGAHLAARLAANTESVTYSPIDDTDSISACPNFAVLIYPAFLIDKNGEPEEKVKPHSGEPPLFLMQTEKDPLMCAKQYGEDAKSAGVDVRVVIYQGGLHGFGLDSNPAFDVSHWPEEVQKWLNEVTISKKSE